MTHARARLEQIAVGHDDVGDLALFDRTDAVGRAGDARGLDRQRLERGFGVSPPSFTVRAALRTKSAG